MDPKRDLKSLVGFVLVCISLGVGMGSAKAYIWAAIDDYQDFKKEVMLRLDVIENKQLESEPSHKDKQIAHMAKRLAFFQKNGGE